MPTEATQIDKVMIKLRLETSCHLITEVFENQFR